MYPNRLLCAVFDEMRACWKTRNFAAMLGLVEEAQSLANRMEAALEDANDVEQMRNQRSELHQEIKALRKEKRKLQDEN